ncbi:MAG: dihydroorotate dehydrogenase electron transfer subunit [Prevotellaceae bacterium]|jgi:dihydroorotate dehydrogenase electron transfer subunit|nr:dihydroorotate dehydrogenase electron transfer subunit [Prevotellaceae bacterium]
MKKYILDLKVKINTQINHQYFLLILGSGSKLPKMLPGQFAEVRIDGSKDTFLRRPISIHFVDYPKNELWLLVQIVGKGTKQLSTYKQGDILNLILPLGNTFTIPENRHEKLLLAGGGVGIAPLLFLGSHLFEKGYKCDFLLGARSKNDLLQINEFQKYGTVFTTTEDGSDGEKGFVTHHSILQNENFDKIYTCGPTPMMKAVAEYAEGKSIYCELSLENTMACGIGACLCCVTGTTEGNLCVCTEGPVFNSTKLKW